jgi:plastocyanin
MKPTAIFLTGLLCAFALAACGSTDKKSASPASAAIAIRDYKFAPATLTVKAGARVTWTNSDTAPHTATAAGTFDTGTLKQGASKTLVLSKPGSYSYVCAFHPFMKGTVEVVK